MAYCYDYPRPMVTVDVILFRQTMNGRELLLIKRKKDPHGGKWALPGGFMEMNETAETAAHRELEEETGVRCRNLRQLATFTTIDRDPRGRVVSIAFTAEVDPAHATLRAADDAADARWFSINKLPALAFDHNEIISLALQKS